MEKRGGGDGGSDASATREKIQQLSTVDRPAPSSPLRPSSLAMASKVLSLPSRFRFAVEGADRTLRDDEGASVLLWRFAAGPPAPVPSRPIVEPC